jgi:hypothetical protein
MLITQGTETINDISDDAAGVCPLLVAQESSDIFDEHSTGDSDPPTPKRLRLGEETKRFRPNEDTMDVLIRVSRRERATLLKEFQRNQRLARKKYKSSIRALWDAELADDKGNASGTTGEEIDSEVEAEAYEDYLFTKMMRYDSDTAFQLVEFRNILRIVPESLGGPNSALIRDRTMALWEGLRRVYFGTTEVSPARDPTRTSRAPIRTFNARTETMSSQSVQEGIHDEDTLHHVPDDEPDPVATRGIADLRREIADLEARARRRRSLDGSGRPLLPYQREDDDDDPDSSDPRGILNPESSSSDVSRGTASETTVAAPRSGTPPRQEDN